jgi:integrase
MHNIFSHAASDGYIARNPVAVAKPKVDPKAPGETEAYTLEEMALTLAALDSDKHAQEHAVMSVAFCGLRRGEVAGLMWQDIDYKAKLLRVERSARGGVAGERPKNRQSKRIVVLDAEVLASLKALAGEECRQESKRIRLRKHRRGPAGLGSLFFAHVAPYL